MTNEADFDLKDRTKTFARRVIAMFAKLPKSDVARVLGRQVLRSGTSVGANYREADEARSKAEFISKMGDSLRELSETEYRLELLVESKKREAGEDGRAAGRNPRTQTHFRHDHPHKPRRTGLQMKTDRAAQKHWSLVIGNRSFR